jgi:tRNA1Val (adenine37-N6)-methyltransferase
MLWKKLRTSNLKLQTDLPNSYFKFKQFTIHQDRCAMKVTTDACLFGAWAAREVESEKLKVESSLDIGTGTGLLSLMLAQKIKTQVDCIEIDRDAAQQAKENAESSPWKERIGVINADVKKFPLKQKYDLIISNPPFYEKEIRSSKDNKNLAHHSDELKLDELLRIIRDNLAVAGDFFLLLPYKRNEEVKKLFKNHQLHIEKIVFVRQSTKHDYFRIMLKGKLIQKEIEATEFEEMSIWDEQQKYTAQFVDLLKDYYLHL